MPVYSKPMIAGWADMDFNSHLRAGAYIDKACDVRLMLLAEQGYSMAELLRLKLGTVAMKDELEHYRHVGLHLGWNLARRQPLAHPARVSACGRQDLCAGDQHRRLAGSGGAQARGSARWAARRMEDPEPDQ